MDQDVISSKAGKAGIERFRLLPRCLGAAVLLLGLMVILAWHIHWLRLIQLSPELPPMKYNTALGFFLTGLSLVLLTLKRMRPVFWGGCFTGLMGVLTFLEYLGNWNLSIDQIFIK
jgi:hypothetical protein